MSEWHTPVAPISTMTSLGYGPSSCTSTSRSGWCGCSSTAACVIVETSDMVETSNIRQDLKLTHNSWTGRMHAEYRWIMKQLDSDPHVRVIVLAGSGSSFCIGADSQALAKYVHADGYDPALPADAEQPGYGVRPEFDADMAWQFGMRPPIIAAVNGACAGIAVALVAFCDIRFAVEGAKITTAAPRLGLPAEYGLSWILPRIVGLSHAADILLSGRVLLAEELKAMGFFNDVFPQPEFEQRVEKYAHMLAELSPDSISTAKRQLYGDLLHTNVREAIEQSKVLIAESMSRPDYAEGVAAFLEKRQPRFVR